MRHAKLSSLALFALVAGGGNLRADDKKPDPQVVILKSVLEKATEELESLRKRISDLEDDRVKLVIALEQARRELIKAQNTEKLARAIAEDNAKKVEELL